MSLDALLLEKLNDWRPIGRDTLTVDAPEDGWRCAITADATDLVGARLWDVSLRRTRAVLPVEDLKARAEVVAGRVTGLLESLRLIEVDAPRKVALLRSEKPTPRGGAAHYYEVLLHADGAATLHRYEGPHEGEPQRRPIAFTLTHEVLAKLVADFAAD